MYNESQPGAERILVQEQAVQQVFISYSSADRGWAEVLEQKLAGQLNVFRDKSRLTAGQPYQDELFHALEQSSALVIIWSKNVKDIQGAWKEWVITEREHFRIAHPEAPIVYLLLDQEVPSVDGHTHKLQDVVGQNGPEKVGDDVWAQLIQRIKQAVSPHTIEIACYVLVCTDKEFATLKGNPNLEVVLQTLGLDFDQVATWYTATREQWRPAGASPVGKLLGELEQVVTNVLKEEGVPGPLRDNQVLIKSGLTGLWNVLDQEAKKEVDRLAKTDFCWVFIDPLSLYHPNVQTVANRVVGCRERNQWLNLFILDPIGRVHDRSDLRSKLETDFPSLYLPLVKPKFLVSMSCLGGVDVWHADDFERAFRETVRLRSNARSLTQSSQAPQRRFTTIGA